MTLALALGAETWPVGTPDTLHAFFSTVAVRLEGGAWGSRFPVLCGPLYDGALPAVAAETAIVELRVVRQALALRPAAELVWDADEPAAAAPPIEAPHLLGCFYAPDGRPLVDVLLAALNRLRIAGTGELRVVEAAYA